MKIHYRIIALFMAFTVTLATAGIAVSKHICGNVVEKIAINHPAAPCIHDAKPVKISCPEHGEMVIMMENSKMNCCKETTDYIKDDHPKNVTSSDLSFGPEFFILYPISFTYSFFNDCNFESELNFVNTAIPPLINQEKYVLIDSFRL